MSGHGLGVFVICPLEACAGSFVCMSDAGTMQNHNMSLQLGHLRLGPDTFFSCLGLFYAIIYLFLCFVFSFIVIQQHSCIADTVQFTRGCMSC